MSNKRRMGQLGEAAFLHRATAKGLMGTKPFGDTEPYDFIIDNGRDLWRVQVKSSATMFRRGIYQVNSSRHVPPQGRAPAYAVPYLESEVDFLAIYIIPEIAWYIVPIQFVARRTSLSVYAETNPKRNPLGAYKEAWHLLQEPGGESRERPEGEPAEVQKSANATSLLATDPESGQLAPPKFEALQVSTWKFCARRLILAPRNAWIRIRYYALRQLLRSLPTKTTRTRVSAPHHPEG